MTQYDKLRAGEAIVDHLVKRRSAFFTPKQLSQLLDFPSATIYRALWRLEGNGVIKGKAMVDKNSGHWVRHYKID